MKMRYIIGGGFFAVSAVTNIVIACKAQARINRNNKEAKKASQEKGE